MAGLANLEFGGIIPFPRGEGAPVRTLGRMRNGDIFHFRMQLVKMVITIGYYHLNQVQSMRLPVAVPHPSRLRRSTFPPGEGFWLFPRQCFNLNLSLPGFRVIIASTDETMCNPFVNSGISSVWVVFLELTLYETEKLLYNTA